MRRRRIARYFEFGIVLGVLASSAASLAHEADAPFSGAIHDPLELHHAHIENEQRLNTAAVRMPPSADGVRRFGFQSELEMAWSDPTFRFGFEVFVPFMNVPTPAGDRRATGVGDIELRPIKLALWMEREFVVSIATGVLLPTGSRERGLGNGNTAVAEYLLVDRAIGIGSWASMARLESTCLGSGASHSSRASSGRIRSSREPAPMVPPLRPRSRSCSRRRSRSSPIQRHTGQRCASYRVWRSGGRGAVGSFAWA